MPLPSASAGASLRRAAFIAALRNRWATAATWRPAPKSRSAAKGTLKIHRIVAATDPGYAVNPAQIERQVAGSFAFGLSALLYGECTVKDGRIEQKNFDTYKIMRMEAMPKVETIVMPSGGFWGGVGEPTIFVAAPAVLNAIYAATGKRIRSIPLKDQNLKRPKRIRAVTLGSQHAGLGVPGCLATYPGET